MQFFGLFPSNNYLKFYSLLNFFITIAILISAFFIFPVLREENSLSLLVGGLVFVGILLTNLMNIFEAFISRKEQAKIYDKFDEIDKMLSNQLLININYKNICRRLLIKYALIAFVLLTIHAASIVSVVINELFLRYYIHLIFPVIIIRFRCIQNIFYVDLIKEKLNLLNTKLHKDVVQRNHEKILFVVEKFQAPQREKKTINISLYDTIMTMKAIYGKIWDITNLCNDCFGYSLLFIVRIKYDN